MWINSKCFCLYSKRPSVFTAGLSCLSLKHLQIWRCDSESRSCNIQDHLEIFQLWMVEKHKSEEFFYCFQVKEKEKKAKHKQGTAVLTFILTFYCFLDDINLRFKHNSFSGKDSSAVKQILFTNLYFCISSINNRKSCFIGL